MTLFGYGDTNKAIAKKFAGECIIFDDKFSEAGVDEWGNRLLPSHLFDPKDSKIEIVSPGIPPFHPLVKKARNPMSDYDFFADSLGFNIWISGTNGKTTTTEITTHLLKKWGAKSGGNIGTPLAQMGDTPIKVLETSSFTMHYTKVAKPNIYLLLPITPDHLSWHGSFEAYEAAKLSVLDRMYEAEAIILPKKYAEIPTDGYKIVYEEAKDLADFFGIDITRIAHKEPFLLNSVMALGVLKILFDELDYDLLNSYKVGAHKIEEFFDKKERLWVNDSKATNANATAAALKRYKDRKIHLIFGGDDKGASLEEVFFVASKIDVIFYLIGSNIERTKRLCERFGKPFIECGTLEIAISKIDKAFHKGEVGLLSPAAASLDQFGSYKERGELFVRLIQAL